MAAANPSVSQAISRAPDTFSASIENVGIDHGRAHVLVAQESVDRSYIVPVFKEDGSQKVPKGVEDKTS